jgi:sulfite exporter TauE/SafE
MAQQVKILGILHIVFGALCVLGGLIAFAVMGGIAGIVGSTGQSNDAAVAVPVLAAIGFFVCVLCLVVGPSRPHWRHRAAAIPVLGPHHHNRDFRAGLDPHSDRNCIGDLRFLGVAQSRD